MVKILSGIVAALALAFIVGGVAMYRENGEVKARQEAINAATSENSRRMDRLDNRIERLENYVYRERGR